MNACAFSISAGSEELLLALTIDAAHFEQNCFQTQNMFVAIRFKKGTKFVMKTCWLSACIHFGEFEKLNGTKAASMLVQPVQAACLYLGCYVLPIRVATPIAGRTVLRQGVDIKNMDQKVVDTRCVIPWQWCIPRGVDVQQQPNTQENSMQTVGREGWRAAMPHNMRSG